MTIKDKAAASHQLLAVIKNMAFAANAALLETCSSALISLQKTKPNGK